jgi:hypothetical protein
MNSDIISDTTPLHVESIGSISDISIYDAEYSGIPEKGININESTQAYREIGNTVYLGWSKSINHGDYMAIYRDGSTITGLWPINSHTLPVSVVKTKTSGIHGDGIIMSFDNANTVPSLQVVNSQRKKYTIGKSFTQDGSIYDAAPQVYINHSRVDKIGTSQLATFISNIYAYNPSIYGGSSYRERSYSEYITTGFSIDSRTDNSATKYVFGGDTYIGLFDYAIVYATDPIVSEYPNVNIDPNSSLPYSGEVTAINQIGNINALIPLETSINMRISNSKSYVTSGSNFAIQKDPGIHFPAQSAEGKYSYSQPFPQYAYNSAYSSDLRGGLFLSKVDIVNDSGVYDSRVHASEQSNFNERFSQWSIFKAANYKDVDNKYGEITRLKEFGGKLYFMQENAFGVLSVSDRSLIQDNNTGGLLTLGTGTLLNRYDYISTTIGLHKNAIQSISSSSSGLYWYSHSNPGIYRFDSNIQSLSKTYGLQYIINNSQNNIGMKVPMGYNELYNEVNIYLSGIEDPKTNIL